MKRVAICLSGEARSLEVTKDLFKSVENISGYQFDFFISTWKSGYDNTVKCFPHLKAYSILDESKYKDHTEFGKVSNNFKYSFLLKHCNLLKQQYEYDNNFLYDCVITTRLDVIFTDFVHGLEKFFNLTKRCSFNGLMICTNDNIGYSDSMIQVDDNIAFMNSATSDVFTNIHFLYYEDVSNTRHHSLEVNAHIIRRLSIVYRQLGCSMFIIRPSAVYKWLSLLKESQATDYNLDIKQDKTKTFTNKAVNVKRNLNNLRIQGHVKGQVVIDLRNKEFMFDKLGYRTLLDAYYDNLAFRDRHCKVTYLVDKSKSLKETIADLIKNEMHHHKDSLMLVSPKSFLSFQHNNFYDAAVHYELSYLSDNEKLLNDIVILNNEAKNKLLELEFNSIDDIDLNTFASSFANKQSMQILESTDLNTIKTIYN